MRCFQQNKINLDLAKNKIFLYHMIPVNIVLIVLACVACVVFVYWFFYGKSSDNVIHGMNGGRRLKKFKHSRH
jgi:hypothetical protein